MDTKDKLILSVIGKIEDEPKEKFFTLTINRKNRSTVFVRFFCTDLQSNIKVGDTVRVDYYIEKGKHYVHNITNEKPNTPHKNLVLFKDVYLEEVSEMQFGHYKGRQFIFRNDQMGKITIMDKKSKLFIPAGGLHTVIAELDYSALTDVNTRQLSDFASTDEQSIIKKRNYRYYLVQLLNERGQKMVCYTQA